MLKLDVPKNIIDMFITTQNIVLKFSKMPRSVASECPSQTSTTQNVNYLAIITSCL